MCSHSQCEAVAPGMSYAASTALASPGPTGASRHVQQSRHIFGGCLCPAPGWVCHVAADPLSA